MAPCLSKVSLLVLLAISLGLCWAVEDLDDDDPEDYYGATESDEPATFGPVLYPMDRYEAEFEADDRLDEFDQVPTPDPPAALFFDDSEEDEPENDDEDDDEEDDDPHDPELDGEPVPVEPPIVTTEPQHHQQQQPQQSPIYVGGQQVGNIHQMAPKADDLDFFDHQDGDFDGDSDGDNDNDESRRVYHHHLEEKRWQHSPNTTPMPDILAT